ncbi:hypothetical protein MKX01_018255, partial [Papaver californicum]
MLSRFISRSSTTTTTSSSSSNLRFLTLISSSATPNSFISASSYSNPIYQNPNLNPFFHSRYLMQRIINKRKKRKKRDVFNRNNKKNTNFVSNLWKLGADNNNNNGYGDS